MSGPKKFPFLGIVGWPFLSGTNSVTPLEWQGVLGLLGETRSTGLQLGPHQLWHKKGGVSFLVLGIGVQTALCTGEVSFSPSAHRDSLSSSFRARPQLGIDISDSCYRRGAQRPRREGQGAECSLSGQHSAECQPHHHCPWSQAACIPVLLYV